MVALREVDGMARPHPGDLLARRGRLSEIENQCAKAIESMSVTFRSPDLP